MNNLKQTPTPGSYSIFFRGDLATFSLEGKTIDTYVWSYIVADTWEGHGDIDVKKDTLLEGRKKDVNDKELTEIWSKTIITPLGRFKNIYSNFPKREG